MLLFLVFGSCSHIRDRLLGEWLISESLDATYTLEFHPDGHDSLNATLWRDDISTPKGFNFETNALIANAHINFESSQAGSVFVSGKRVAKFEYAEGEGYIEFDSSSYVVRRTHHGFNVVSGQRKLYVQRALGRDKRDIEDCGLIVKILHFCGLERFTGIVYILAVISGSIMAIYMGYTIVKSSLGPRPERLQPRARRTLSTRKREDEKMKTQ